jgi:hypothetical protein
MAEVKDSSTEIKVLIGIGSAILILMILFITFAAGFYVGRSAPAGGGQRMGAIRQQQMGNQPQGQLPGGQTPQQGPRRVPGGGQTPQQQQQPQNTPGQ